MLRKTKIIATLGPATHGRDMLRQLIERGVDVFRINMSHARHDTVREVVGIIREESAAMDRSVAILVDLQGPSIRTGDLPEPYTLKAGDVVEFRNDDLVAGQPLSTTVNYVGLSEDVSVGDTLLADNGVIHFKVVTKSPGRLVCETLTAGQLGSRRHINLPGVRVNLPSLTKKDLLDIDLAISIQADYVALSFVRDARHVQQLRDLLGEKECSARIVAKIEDQEAVRHLQEIIIAADAVMVARGDLGIEVHIEELPVIQRTILKECARIGRKVIVATHMLESMIENPVPTRAEITDVANAVYEQTDAVMLSGESSVGKHPLECVSVLDRIAKRMEREPGAGFCQAIELKSEKQFTVKAAVVLADSLPESHVLVFTARGIMANYVAHQRPRNSHIFAFTPDPVVQRALHLNRAVTPFHMEFAENPEATIRQAIEHLKSRSFVAAGDPVVILSDVLTGDFDTNSVLLRKV
ncbi:MAG: pyruvate kinase [Verrucomicrobiales bacterium]